MLISIIIPIYNVAPYLQQCLQSVLEQTFSNYEVLLIDDCGQDDSMQICKRFLDDNHLNDKAWTIIHHDKNRGLSAARNTGIATAKGDYVFFLDSDDTITPDCMAILSAFVEQENDVDMVVGDYQASDGKPTSCGNHLAEGVYTDELLHLFLSGQYIVPVWNKLVRLSFIKENGLYFCDGLIHEDNLWSLQAACRMKKMAVTTRVTYNYLIRESSLAHSKNAQIHELNYVKANIKMAEFVCGDLSLKKNPEIYHWIEKDRWCRFLTPGWNQHTDTFGECYKLIRDSAYWSVFDLLCMPFTDITKGAWLRALHVFLPCKLGYRWYVKCYTRFGI